MRDVSYAFLIAAIAGGSPYFVDAGGWSAAMCH